MDTKLDAAAELPGVTELVKSFQTAGDLDGSGYAHKFVDLPADFGWQREEGTMRSVGAWITHGETRRDEDGCVLARRKMLKDVGKGGGLICERGPHPGTFREALGNGFKQDGRMPRRAPKSIDVPEHEGDKQFIAYAPRYKAIGGRKMAV